jgi:hypothetical protein
MKEQIINNLKNVLRSSSFYFFAGSAFLLVILFFLMPKIFIGKTTYVKADKIANVVDSALPPAVPPLDTALYDKKINELANNPPPPIISDARKIDAKTGKPIVQNPNPAPAPKPNIWPVKTIYPNPGAILPFNRIVAYYGNLYSAKMGVLGEYPEAQMLAMLGAEVKKWSLADPNTPVIPALHYIAVVAQGSPGDDGKYRLRMPYSEIDKVITMATKINALVFLDVQLGFSNVRTEIPLLSKYLKMPNVHLAIDPEFSMKTGIRPGKIVGTLDATDINFAANYLAGLVRENNLTPKILIIHRYTQKMVTNYKQIKILPEVQMIMNMDGWGEQDKKISTYDQFIYSEPIQFTGFKLFYKNDTITKGTALLSPYDLLKLSPQPIYIQYQ